MEMLILGVDGLGQKSLEALRLKKLSKLIDQSKSQNPTIDNVVSRGWAELYSGQTAYESGAFYQIPVVDNGVIRASQKTGVPCVAGHVGQENLLWNKMRSKGRSVGIYTLPSVTEVQNGAAFTVSATGGGNFKNSISSSEIYPPEFLNMVNYSGLNLGLRIGYGAFQPTDINHLEQWIRTHCAQHFYTMELALEKWPVDCLVFGTRFATLAYKFAALLSSEPRNAAEESLKGMLLNVAEDYDDYLAKFVKNVDPKHLFIVSDHGVGPLQYQVNVNELLVKVGEMAPKKSGLSRAKRNARTLINAVFNRGSLTGNAPYFPAYDLESSKSFSIGYTDVIYINDQRFTGPTLSVEQRYEKSTVLARKLKVYAESHGLEQFVEFTPLRNDGLTEPAAPDQARIPLPDIRCVLAEGCANLGRTNREIVLENRPKFGDEMFQTGFFSEYSGCKHTDTIAGYIGPNADQVDMSNLPAIHRSIVNILER